MSSEKKVVNFIITNLIRFILILTFIYASTSQRTLVQTVSIIALLITFIPPTLKRLFNIQIPSSTEIIYLMFIYGLLILGELRGFYHGSIWWSIIMTFTASIVLGLTGLSIVHVLQKTNRISASPLLGAILIFAISLSFATLWEIFEFVLDAMIHSGLQKGLIDTMQDLSINLFGAFLASIAGYNNIKNKSSMLVSTFLSGILEKNSSLLGPKRNPRTPKRIAQDMIRIGETAKIEFKSTLRTNLHTGLHDKKIELAFLKTIVAFLNTSGGNLLIGIDDNKNILGLEKDGFQNDDKINLHFTNLIRSHIGNEFLPFIKSIIIPFGGVRVLLIICKESKRRVFLKHDGMEEFYIRNGPASVKIEGNALIDYVSHKFF